jgi:hypothetical protein
MNDNENLKSEWKLLVEFHSGKLEIAKAKLKQLEEGTLTQFQFREKVSLLANEKSAAFKQGWKKIIENGMVENVCGILEECYSSFLDSNNVELEVNAKDQLGEENSLKRQEFKFKVIKRLFEEGSFGNEKEEYGFEDFEDTAGGCDETAWNAGLWVLTHNSQ